MKTSLCTEVLAMAIKNRKYPNKKLIHHSDSGFQYCNPKYTEFAESNGIMMSMTEQYNPYKNAIAERINRTLKYEYELRNCIKNTDIAQQITKQAVYIYNNLRTHCSLDLRKPAEVHLNPNIKYKPNDYNLILNNRRVRNLLTIKLRMTQGVQEVNKELYLDIVDLTALIKAELDMKK